MKKECYNNAKSTYYVIQLYFIHIVASKTLSFNNLS